MKSVNSRKTEDIAGTQEVMDIIGRDPWEIKLHK